ncbi:MAG: hypothetical protein K0R06_1799 [Clostridium sp.]|jgi:hypothetical protein|nr:hypothetical protein [Clostridium sp.]
MERILNHQLYMLTVFFRQELILYLDLEQFQEEMLGFRH